MTPPTGAISAKEELLALYYRAKGGERVRVYYMSINTDFVCGLTMTSEAELEGDRAIIRVENNVYGRGSVLSMDQKLYSHHSSLLLNELLPNEQNPEWHKVWLFTNLFHAYAYELKRDRE